MPRSLRTNSGFHRLPVVAVSLLLLVDVASMSARGVEPESHLLVVGHRGLIQAAPENTLAGFRACLALRVGFEFDIRQTRDGKLVCMHDETLDRTTDGKGRLADLSLDELRRLDAGGRFDTAFLGERIPHVDDVFALVAESKAGAVLVAVDLKETGNGIEEAVVDLAKRHKVLDRLVFIGATIESAEVRQRLHSASRQARAARLALAPQKLGEAIADPQADWIYVRFLPSSDDVARIHQAGKRIFLAGPLVAGTETENWNKAADLEVDAILTDYPLELRKRVRRATFVK